MEILLVPVAAPLFKSRSIAEHTFSISVFAFFVSGNTENIKSAVKTNLAEGKDGKTHYAVLNVSLVLNKKSDNYKKYTQDFLTNQDDTSPISFSPPVKILLCCQFGEVYSDHIIFAE